MTHPLLTLTDDVADALRDGRPVVALESTIISHGMPYPQNVAMALEVEGIIRAAGAVARDDRRPRRPTLDRADAPTTSSCSPPTPDVTKVSVRDLPFVVARGAHGATTVAATMRLAALAGHRGLRHRRPRRRAPRRPADLRRVSADLTEMASTRVAVVSRRREVDPRHRADPGVARDPGGAGAGLRHRRVPLVLLRGPAATGRRCASTPPARSPPSCAPQWDLGLDRGLVVANPIPVEDEIPAEEIGRIIDRALADMDALGIHGKDATPYLLGRIVEISDGASLIANIALVRNNARLGAQIAREYAALVR